MLLPPWQNESIGNSAALGRRAEIFQCLMGVRSNDTWSVPPAEESANEKHDEKMK